MADAGSSLRQALSAIALRLQDAGIERARAEARLLAAQALGISVEAVVGDDGRVLSETEQRALDDLARRRARREPMSQILGYREFYGRRFAVTADVLTPRPDSETLIEAVLSHVDRAAPLRLLELGVGSGCLLLTLLAELPQTTGVGVDLSQVALAVARANAATLGVAGRCALIEGDWTSSVAERFDVVISNPPYIPSKALAQLDPEVSWYEPRLALDGGEDGLTFYRRVAADCERLLIPGGLLAVEIGQGQCDDVTQLLRQGGLEVLESRRDLAGIERCIRARKP
ncbi:MAG: Methylase of polypeptide chain release factor [Alphaproteobacteria bacterium]|nr:Methylase of polypeptide chain release factor [Alphaproteobacteria bacterium]